MNRQFIRCSSMCFPQKRLKHFLHLLGAVSLHPSNRQKYSPTMPLAHPTQRFAVEVPEQLYTCSKALVISIREARTAGYRVPATTARSASSSD